MQFWVLTVWAILHRKDLIAQHLNLHIVHVSLGHVIRDELLVGDLIRGSLTHVLDATPALKLSERGLCQTSSCLCSPVLLVNYLHDIGGFLHMTQVHGVVFAQLLSLVLLVDLLYRHLL